MSDTETPRHLTTSHLRALRSAAQAVALSTGSAPDLSAGERRLRDKCQEILALVVLEPSEGEGQAQ